MGSPPSSTARAVETTIGQSGKSSRRASAQCAAGIGQRCFYCEKPVTSEPAITWNGVAGQTWLHPGCTADLSARLLADVVRWQRQSGRRFHDRERRK